MPYAFNPFSGNLDYFAKNADVITPVTETPTGAINGANVTFILSAIPIADSLILLLNGVTQTETSDYTLATATITMQSAPLVGDILTAYYLEA